MSLIDDVYNLIAAGQSPRAEATLKSMVVESPKDGEAWYLFGSLLAGRKAHGQAIKALKTAIQVGWRTPEVFNNLGSVYLDIKKLDAARSALQEALKIAPDMAVAHVNLSRAWGLQNSDEAIKCCLNALDSEPNNFDALIQLGHLYQAANDDYRRAQVCIDKALAVDPNRFEGHRALSGIFNNRGMMAAAAISAQRALSINPEDPSSNLALALAQLSRGQFETGWRFYKKRPITSPLSNVPEWAGEKIAGASVLVWTEQGIGDEIIYATMLPDLIETEATITLACSSRLVPIFKRSFPRLAVCSIDEIQGGQTETEFSFQIGLADLGLHFRNNAKSFPFQLQYLWADENETREFRAKYEALSPGGRLIGLAWRSVRAAFGGQKSSELELWAEILRAPGFSFVCLQYDATEEEIADFNAKHGTKIIFDSTVDQMTDMDRFFSQVAACDQVISTSNTIVHCAASLGVPTWLVLPSGRKQPWYWQREGSQTPFYGSVSIFRSGDDSVDPFPAWADILSQVQQRLLTGD